MQQLIAPAIEDLCAAFERGGYSPSPVIDLGVLVAKADGTIDDSERDLLVQVLQTLLETKLSAEVIDALITASAEVIDLVGVGPRARLVGAILSDCDAAEAGLRVALAVAFASEGLSDSERRVIELIGDEADVSPARVSELVEEIRQHADPAGPCSTRNALRGA
ncbi:MAG: TerB family tellurite resistance protein [Polyangiaceae bacterium]|nr:TerB family tellurite resistance protein [Polyangiaceae bacterium]